MVRPKYKLYTPGPVDVPREYLREMSSELVYHREASFADLQHEVVKGLRRLLMTEGQVYLVTASGTGGMETAVSNLVAPGDKAVVVVTGKFGERWREIVIRFGGYVDELARPFGESIPPEELERRLRTNDAARCVFTTLTETSTGALSDIKAFGDICHRLNRILVVDAVAGLGADELRMDAWHVDVVVGGSQKGFAVPPGLSVVGLSDKAWERVEKCRSTRYYFDLRQYRKYAEKGQTPWTPAISIYYALDLSLRRMLRRGMAAWWKDHASIAEMLRRQVRLAGLEIFPQQPSNALTVIKMPEGIDATRVIDILKRRYKVLLANGQAEMRGKVIRIGHMGPVVKSDMSRVFGLFLRAYREVVRRHRS